MERFVEVNVVDGLGIDWHKTDHELLPFFEVPSFVRYRSALGDFPTPQLINYLLSSCRSLRPILSFGECPGKVINNHGRY